MNIIISDKKKKDLFISIFQLLKNSSSKINVLIDENNFHVQGMDISHICLFDLNLNKNWFNHFEISEKTNLCFDSNIFYSMISIKNDEQNLIIKKDSEDNLNIELINGDKKNDYDKYFTLPLLDFDYDEMSIPKAEYDVEFSLTSKKISDIFAQLFNFGNDLIIKCQEENIDFKTKGNSGEMRVRILVDDLSSYSIVEGEELELTYSLTYINKMCITNKISSDIDFYLGNDCPMKIKYHLGDDSSLMFYIAPKLNDD
jgi:proliferating cell nuclear antigen PCNA